jgi:flavin reductase (DIM6/NTAB) family NADH-FMN oxidoreductase RutF
MTNSPPTPQTDTPRPGTDGSAVGLALGRIPSGLFIVTWRDGDQDRGMLASWVMQAGFEPPMLTIAVAPSRGLLAAVEADTPFVVNVLAEHQRPLLARFGKPAASGEDPFAGLPVSRTSCGAPALGEAAAWLECSPVAQASGTNDARCDHVVVLARITAAGAGPDTPPLVHLRKNGLRY